MHQPSWTPSPVMIVKPTSQITCTRCSAVIHSAMNLAGGRPGTSFSQLVLTKTMINNARQLSQREIQLNRALVVQLSEMRRTCTCLFVIVKLIACWTAASEPTKRVLTDTTMTHAFQLGTFVHVCTVNTSDPALLVAVTKSLERLQWPFSVLLVKFVWANS